VTVHFGEFSLDADARQLLRSGKPVTLTPKAFQLLELLVSRQPRAVSKADIHDRLWPSTFVSEGNIARLMFEVRAALGDDTGDSRYIRTLRGFGYAFTASPSAAGSSEEVPTGVAHRLLWRERHAALRPGDNVLGRGSEATVWVDAPSVSRRHALIRVDGERAVLTDMDSKNGTSVVGRTDPLPQTLQDGDVIRLGSERILYRAVSSAASTRSASRGR
jgi:DNA-binding winged helix-turn-helix (wHTH) protein